MPGTVNIPLTTLAPGAHDFGPAALADTDSQVTLTVNRNVANGFNSQPATTTASIQAYQSNDSGSTWNLIIAGTIVGGAIFDEKTGTTGVASSVSGSFNPGTGRQAKASIVIAGASVAVSGSLAIS